MKNGQWSLRTRPVRNEYGLLELGVQCRMWPPPLSTASSASLHLWFPLTISGFRLFTGSELSRPFTHFPLGCCDHRKSVSRQVTRRELRYRPPQAESRQSMENLRWSTCTAALQLNLNKRRALAQLLRAAISRSRRVSMVLQPLTTSFQKQVRRYSGLGRLDLDSGATELLTFDVIRAGHDMQLGRRRGRVWMDTVDL